MVNKGDLQFSTLAVEELAQENMGTLLAMRDLLMTGSNFQEMRLSMKDGHSWVVEKSLGLIGVRFVCPGGGPHGAVCQPPDEMTPGDIAFLNGDLFREP